MSSQPEPDIRALLLDYGGVLAEEGFREGLMAIGRSTAMGPDRFFSVAADAVYASGYLTGHATEHEYWQTIRRLTDVQGTDEQFRQAILGRFILREWMLELLRNVRSAGYTVCVLSDQTQWLDELDARDGFFHYFHHVYNSYHIGKGKRDATVFTDVAAHMKVSVEHILFVDDNEGNVARARSKGLHAIHYRDKESFLRELHSFGLV
jgi:putative hydrolase of the HAD superfamily